MASSFHLSSWLRLTVAILSCSVVVVVGGGGGAAARAEILVLVDGQTVETDGPWEVRGGQIVYTARGGTLSSIRASLVDMVATEEANRPPPPPDQAPPAPRPPALVIKQGDVGYASESAVSTARFAALLASLDEAERLRIVRALLPSLRRIVRLDVEVDILSPGGLERTIPLLESDVVKFRRLAASETDPALSEAYDLLASDTERFVSLARSHSGAALDEIADGWRELRRAIGYQ